MLCLCGWFVPRSQSLDYCPCLHATIEFLFDEELSKEDLSFIRVFSFLGICMSVNPSRTSNTNLYCRFFPIRVTRMIFIGNNMRNVSEKLRGIFPHRRVCRTKNSTLIFWNRIYIFYSVGMSCVL